MGFMVAVVINTVSTVITVVMMVTVVLMVLKTKPLISWETGLLSACPLAASRAAFLGCWGLKLPATPSPQHWKLHNQSHYCRLGQEQLQLGMLAWPRHCDREITYVSLLP
jgi:hypothetical protein